MVNIIKLVTAFFVIVVLGVATFVVFANPRKRS
jgi:hypothetical protein